jgi:hypothetical protein
MKEIAKHKLRDYKYCAQYLFGVIKALKAEINFNVKLEDTFLELTRK